MGAEQHERFLGLLGAKHGVEKLVPCFDEPRMVEIRPHLGYAGCSRPQFLLSLGNMFPVLAATRVRTIGGGEHGQRMLEAVTGHLLQRFEDQWVPVPVGPIPGQIDLALVTGFFESRQQLAVLRIQGA